MTQATQPTDVADVAADGARNDVDRPHGGSAAGGPAVVQRWEWALLGAVVVALVWSLGRIAGVGDMLGHDEAVYAVRARTWLLGEPTTSWFPHRAPGLPVLGVPLLALGLGTGALRVVGIVFAVVAVVSAWALARRVGGPAAAPIAAAGVGFAPPLLGHGARYLTDLPAAALVVALMILVAWQAERDDGPGPGLLWAAPLAAGALYLRMGAALPLLLVALAGLALWPRQVRRGWRWVAATGAVTVGLLLPHLAGAVTAFGVPWGRVLYTATLTRTDAPGRALGVYLDELPGALAGTPAGVLMATGLIGLPVILVARRRWDGVARAGAFVWAVGIGNLVAMGITAEPDVRFIFVAVVLLCVAGAVAVGLVVGPRGRLAVVVGGTVVAALVVLGVAVGTPVVATDRAERDDRYAAMRAAARTIVAGRSAESAGSSAADAPIGAALPADAAQPCLVVTSYVPQVEWLTGCATYAFDDPDLADLEAADQATWALLLRDGKRQPVGAERDALLAGATRVGEWDLAPGRIGAAQLYRLDRLSELPIR